MAACSPGTCQDVLDRVYTWADSRSDRVLYGSLGSGKTTLPTAVAEKYDKENRLTGTFFFSGDPSHDSDPSTESSSHYIPKFYIPIPSFKKGQSSPEFRPCYPLETQFHSLLVGPFRRRRFDRALTRSFLKVWAALSFAQVFFEVDHADFRYYMTLKMPTDV